MHQIYRVIAAAAMLIGGLLAYGFNLRQINTDDGLSNSAVLSLYCGSNGLLWVGTCDGLNAYDGHCVYPTRQIPEYASLSGNIIESIHESAPGTLWVQTNYGLNKLIPSEGVHKVFPQYQGREKVIISPDHTVFVLSENNELSYCRQQDSVFRPLVRIGEQFSDIRETVIFDNTIRLYTASGVVDYPLTRNRDGYTTGTARHMSRRPLLCAFSDGENTLAMDSDHNLLEYRRLDAQPVVLADISEETNRRGAISDMMADNNGNIFISFVTDGLVKYSREYTNHYKAEDLNIDIGVFCMAKSKTQNLVWVGTDCHGVYTIYDGAYNIQVLDFDDFGNKISRPIRAVFLDHDRSLWLGTRGNGLLQVRDFNEANGKDHGEEILFTSANSELADNSVYAFGASSRPLFWIATDNGLNYYSYRDKRIHRIDIGNLPLKLIHGLHEANDSTLLVSTTGNGVFKARISGPADRPVLSDIRQYSIDNGNLSSNYFFSQTTDTFGTPIFGNRGLGIFTLEGDSLKSIHPLKHNYGDPTVNDVFAIVRDKRAIWLGTGHGLLKITPDDDRLYVGSENGFLNSTIHSMQLDEDGHLWISTNQGLMKFNPDTEEAHVYARNYGITSNEFSDGASFNTGKSLIFGGIDGIVIISKNPCYRPSQKYLPQLSIIQLSIAGHQEPLNEHLDTTSDGQHMLRMESNQNYFSLTFSVPDFINSENYIFFYSLDGNNWINNGTSRQLIFTRLAYGKNILRIKYRNRESGVDSGVYTLTIEIAAPWYLSTLAKIIYTLTLLIAIVIVIRIYLLRQKEKQAQVLEKIEQTHKDEMYEGKLRFFTNITHEFCTPLTLIHGSCERILAYQDADAHMKKYVSLIRSNTERLNSLIQDLIDFRRIETGHKIRNIRPVSASEIGNDIYESFTVIAEQNGISFVNEVQPDINFNTDYKALLRIMSNLLSNAFKYTPTGGTVKLGMSMADGKLIIEIFNTGKGISEADKLKIFNRYIILDNVEENATRGLSSRNGLGMAICSSLVELLDGRIEIESEMGSHALFRVTLPPLPCTESGAEDCSTADAAMVLPKVSADTGATSDTRDFSKQKDNILVIDDNRDILTLLCDSLSEYNVLSASNADEGLQALKNNKIDLIITDVMMPGVDGVTLTRHIKGNKHTMHIPLIILSAKNTGAEKIEGLASGADAYVGKPFQLSYLRALIVRLLENRRMMKEYYSTSASAFVYSNGQLVDKESKDFVDRIVDYIDSNIDDTELSTEQLAAHMQMSARNLYRRFKDLELPPPNDFIKSHRIQFAAKLLVTTSLTVQEIIYRSGFNNRSHFYREFDKQFGMTPKDYRNANKTKSSLDSSPISEA